MRWIVVVALWMGCADEANDAVDLSVGTDLAELCPGLNPVRQEGPCTSAGAGWLGAFCYPNSLTYCACNSGAWECCGDAPPRCPSDPPTTGGRCCPGAVPEGLQCSFDGGSASSCACGVDLRWSCH